MTKNKLFAAVLGLLLVAPLAVGQTLITNTTLAAAVTSTSQTSVRLTSATGVVAGSTMLFINGEAMSVNAVNGTTISVTRGQPSSRAATHANGTVVWLGPYSYFQFATPSGYPYGSCTRAGNILPYIDVNNNIFSDCVGGVWTRGVAASSTPLVELSANSGGTAYTSLNTNGTTVVAGTLYCAEIDVPANKLVTGMGLLMGTTAGGSDKHIVALLDASGNVLATSALAGTVTSSTSVYNQIAFTSKYLVVGPNRYYACTQSNGTSDTVRMLVTGTQDTYLTTSKTGTFGTIPTITVPTTFTTAVGPYAYLY